jgi:hypothetical protein
LGSTLYPLRVRPGGAREFGRGAAEGKRRFSLVNLLSSSSPMCSKGVWQLKTLAFRYCPHGGSSRHAREFLKKGLLQFARDNPQVEVLAFAKFNKHPVVEGRYVWGVNKVCDLRNKTEEEIADLIALLRNTSGHKVTLFKTPVYTKLPSVQGTWAPGAFKERRMVVRTATTG